jgi:hypothetical protein
VIKNRNRGGDSSSLYDILFLTLELLISFTIISEKDFLKTAV